MNMYPGVITSVNKDLTVNIVCDIGIKYNNVHLLGQTTGNTVGFVNVPRAGMPIVALVENGLIYALPIAIGSATGDLPGDTGMFDTTTSSSVKMVHRKGIEVKAGPSLSMFFSSVKGALFGILKRIALATNLYKMDVQDDDQKKVGKIDIYDKNYKKTLSINFGEDGGMDNDAIVSIYQHPDGTIELAQNNNTTIEYNENGNITFKCKDYEVDNDKYIIKADTSIEESVNNKKITIDSSKIKLNSDGNIEIDGQVMVTLNANGNKIEINPALIKMAGGSQFIALAIPLLQLLITHTHIDPLSGTTGTAILTGNPTDMVSKSVMSK